MRELFDARFNPDDKPMTQGPARRGGENRRRAGADRHRPHRRLGAQQIGRAAQADRQFRQRRRQYRRRHRRAARHHRHQYAGRAHRGHRRHDHGADPGGAAPAGRRLRRADLRQGLDRLDADLDARPPHLGQAPRHHRHGADRPGGGAPRARLRPADPLSQPPQGGAQDRGRARRHLLGEPRPDARPHGHRLGQLPAHAGDLSPAVGAPAQAAAAARPISSTPRAAR